MGKRKRKKGNIYNAYQDYILCLESDLEEETNPYERSTIEKEIKKLKKEQKKYYVPSVLEMAKFEKTKLTTETKDTLEKSSFGLVKKITNRINNGK